MLDIDIPARALAAAYATASGADCDTACTLMGLAAFTGAELVTTLVGMSPTAEVAPLLAKLLPVDAEWAAAQRGTIVVNGAGRCGITLGYGSVVEPCGRAYAITPPTSGRWVAGYLAPTVTYTAALA